MQYEPSLSVDSCPASEIEHRKFVSLSAGSSNNESTPMAR
jgi:hypothetical protein